MRQIVTIGFFAAVLAAVANAQDAPTENLSSFLEVNVNKSCISDSECTLTDVYGANPSTNTYYKPGFSASNDQEVCCATFPRMIMQKQAEPMVTFNRYCYDMRVLSDWQSSPYKQAYCSGGALNGIAFSLLATVSLIAFLQLF